MEQLIIKEMLEERLEPGSVAVNEMMSRHTTFRIGGPASVFVTPKSEQELVAAINVCRSQNAPYFILGNGSNLLVSDQGYDGVVVHIGSNMQEISVEGNDITAKTGAMLSRVAHTALEHGLTGMEFAAGIPGSLGGACMMNAGAYGGEMSQILVGVRALDAQGQIVELSTEQLDLGYRHSVMMEKQYVVLGARMHLEKGNPSEIQAKMEDLKEKRVSKQPLEFPSAGSTFKRPEGAFAGKLIMDVGLRGFRVGDAMVSEKHCGFVINVGQATAEDVCKVISHVQQVVLEKFGRKLEPEIRFLGFDGKVRA